MKEHLPVLIPACLWVGAWAAWILGFFSYRLSRSVGYLAWLGSLGAAAKALPQTLQQGPWHYSLGGWPPPWGIECVLTPFNGFLALFFLGVGALSYGALGSFGLLGGLLKSRETLVGALLLWMTGGLLGLLLVRDGFSLYLILQMAVVTVVGLIVGSTRKGEKEGFQFLLYGSVGSSFFLGGFLFLHSSTGTFHLMDLRDQLYIGRSFELALAAGVFLVSSFIYFFLFPLPFLSAPSFNQGPLFLWGLLAGLLPRMGLYLLFLFFFFVLNLPGMVLPDGMTGSAAVLGLLPLLAFVQAARQKDLLHAVSYLSLAQLGFPLLGFLCGNKSALTGSLLEIVTQVVGVFGQFLATASAVTQKPGTHPAAQLSGLGRQDPGTALCWVVFLFSIAGIPPTGGSFGKFYLWQGLMEKKDWALLAPLALVFLFNLVMVFRFLWLLFEHRRSASAPTLLTGPAKWRLYLLAGALLFLGGFHSQIVHSFIEPSLPRAYQNVPLPDVPFLGKQVE